MIKLREDISFEEIVKIIINKEKVFIDDVDKERIKKSHEFLKNFSKGRVIYGVNTGFGPMAQWRVSEKHLKDLQYNIIRSHSCGSGEYIGDLEVRGALLARLGTFFRGFSGISLEAVELFSNFLNLELYPFIPTHGSVGASGDLVQMAHIALCMLGEGKIKVEGIWRNSEDILQKFGLQPLQISLREGLSICNGTSMMTGIGIVNEFFAEKLLYLSIVASVWINEVVNSYDDWINERMQFVRKHNGQVKIGEIMRKIVKSSKCLRSREYDLYKNEGDANGVFTNKVQAYYSLRCSTQILGPIYETLLNNRKILEEELTCVSDNPIIDFERENVYHGGNFHGDYISLEADKCKIAITKLTMLAERQLNYLLHDKLNGILPPFLNKGTLGLNYGMQAMQFTATSTTAECQTLAFPNYVHSIPNNQDNQDVVSMGTNSQILYRKVIKNAFEVISILFIALAQAVDCLQIEDKLCETTQKFYADIRKITKSIENDDRAMYDEIKNVVEYLENQEYIF